MFSRYFFPFAVLALVSSSSFAEGPNLGTLVGTGRKGYNGEGKEQTQAQLNNPFGVVRGPDGALYICDTDNDRIRRVGGDRRVTTVAGSGKEGYAGDGGPASAASLHEPYEVRFDALGNMFFVERMSHTVRRVDAKTQVITTVAGTGQPGFSGDGGPATQAQLNQPHSIVFTPEGRLLICDILNHRIRKVDLQSGIISTFAGTGAKAPTKDGGPIAGNPLYGPRAMDFDAQGQLWLALREGNAIYRLDLQAGTIHHVAGTGKQGFRGNGGPALQAELAGPKGISVGPDGNVYFADTESHSIRRVNMKAGTVELVAGTGTRGDGPLGDPLLCKMARPHGIFVGKDGVILVGDSENHQVREIVGAVAK